MATWIVHLRIAELLLAQLDGLDETHFALGNVAPDSGIPDEKWEKFNPPSEITHFKVQQNGHHTCADLGFYRRYLTPLQQSGGDTRQLAFLWGYFFHLVTDNLWHTDIFLPVKVQFAAEFEADPKFIWTVKRDWYGLDFEYVRAHRDSLFWRVFLRGEYAQDWLDFLPAEAIRQQLHYIKNFYQRTDEKIEAHYLNHPGLYLTTTQIDQFVAHSAQKLIVLYQQLQKHQPDTTGYLSALEIRENP